MASLQNISFLLAASFGCSTNLYAQQDSLFTYNKTIPGKYSFFTADNLNNLYLITTDNQLKEINSQGDSVTTFNQVNRFGQLYSIDASNPLKILLYYKDFSTIVVLDKYLNIINTINLRTQGIFNVNSITASYDNNIWLFDEDNAKLKKLDANGNTLLETIDLRTQFDSVPSATQLLDKDGFVFLYDKNKGFYIFDHYGTFKNKIPFTNWQDVDVSKKTLYGSNDTALFQYPLESLNLQQYTLPSSFNKSLQIEISNSKAYILKRNELLIYDVK